MKNVFFAKPPNAPSGTGRPSGGGRGNNSPKGKYKSKKVGFRLCYLGES